MDSFKIAGSVLVAVFAGLLGMAAGSEMKQRILLLEDFHKGILMLHQEITYRKAPLEEAAGRVAHSLEEPWAAFFDAVGQELEQLPGISFYQVWQEQSGKYLAKLPLRTEDRALIGQIGRQMESLETGESGGILTLFEKRLETRIAEAEEEYRGKALLYRRLGVMGGIFLVIVFL